MASKRTKMLEELDKPTQPVVPSETSPVDVLTDGTPYDDRTAAALFAALQQAQPTPAPVAATTPVEPEVSTPQTLEEMLAAQGPPTTAPAPVNTGLPPGVTQADLDAIAAQFRQAGTPDMPAMNFTGDPNQPFFDMRTADGGIDERYFDPNLDRSIFDKPATRVSEADPQCPPGMEYDYDARRCVKIGKDEPPPPSDRCPEGYTRSPVTGECEPIEGRPPRLLSRLRPRRHLHRPRLRHHRLPRSRASRGLNSTARRVSANR